VAFLEALPGLSAADYVKLRSAAAPRPFLQGAPTPPAPPAGGLN